MKKNHHRKTALLLAMMSMSLSFENTQAAGVASSRSAKQHYSIPAQALDDALNAFITATDWQIGFNAAQTQGLKSKGLNGIYTREQALKKILEDTPLDYRVISANSITLEKRNTAERVVLAAADNIQSSPSANQKAVAQVEDPTVLETVNVTDKAKRDVNAPDNSDYKISNAVTATKTDTPIMETPMSVKVVPQQVLKDQQAVTLDQALRNVSGVVSGQGINQEFFVRGFNTFNYYRDGFPFVNNWVHTEDLADIERVEVLKGPGSILFGRAEPGGIINFVTKQPLNTPYYSVRQQFGSYDYYRTDVDATGALTKDNRLAYRFNAAYQTNNSITQFAGNERVFVAPSLRWNITDNTVSTLRIEYSDITNKAENQLLLNADGTQQGFTSRKQNLSDPWAYTKDEYVMLSLNTEHHFNADWGLRHRFNASFGQKTMRTIGAVGTIDAQGNAGRWMFEQNARGKDYLNNFYNSLELTGKFNTGFAKHTLLIGGDYMVTDARATMGPVFGVGGTNIYNPTHLAAEPAINAYNTFSYWQPWFGLYAQDQIELPYHVHLLAGFRYDNARTTGDSNWGAFGGTTTTQNPSVTDDKISPRGGVLWQPIPELSLYGSYTENFGASNATYATQNGQRLAPQTAQQWEVGAKTELLDKRFTGSLTYYDLKKKNLAMQDSIGTWRALGEAETRGLELDISGEILPGWKVIGAYSYMPVAKTLKDTAGSATIGKRLHNAPANNGSLWTTYEFDDKLLNGLKLGAGIQAVGQRQIGYTESMKTAGYVTLNLMASHLWKIGNTKVTAQLNADNLLDKTYLGGVYSYGTGVYGAPRTFMGSIKVEY